MDQKSFIAAITASIILVLLLAGMHAVGVARSNPVPYPRRFPLNIYFVSPQGGTYNTSQIVLSVQLEEISDCNNTIREAWYSLDGQPNLPLSLTFVGMSSHDGNALLHSETLGVATLPPLSDGTHVIWAFGKYSYLDTILQSNVSVTFVINTTAKTASPSPVTSSAPKLSAIVFTYGDASVYGIDGYAPNLAISVDLPVITANSTIVSFTLKILEPFPARGTIVNQSSYYVYRKSLDFYLVSGVLLGYDRTKIIDTLWLNWGDSLNETQIEEERAIYSQTYWVNFTKSDNKYFGTATLPKLSGEEYNATIWVRAEQDQVTTYIPFWLAVYKTVPLAPTPKLSSEPVPFTPNSTAIPTFAPSDSPTMQSKLEPTTTVSTPIADSAVWLTPLNFLMMLAALGAIAVALSLFLYLKAKIKQKRG